MEYKEELHFEPLALPLTRPTTKAGINQEFMFLSLGTVVELQIITGSMLVYLLYIPLHAIGYLIAIYDPFLVPIFINWFRLAVRNRNRAFWNARSYSP